MSTCELSTTITIITIVRLTLSTCVWCLGSPVVNSAPVAGMSQVTIPVESLTFPVTKDVFSGEGGKSKRDPGQVTILIEGLIFPVKQKGLKMETPVETLGFRSQIL